MEGINKEKGRILWTSFEDDNDLQTQHVINHKYRFNSTLIFLEQTFNVKCF